jgi:CubicO group peptidase (beta-lactamase class C family)
MKQGAVATFCVLGALAGSGASAQPASDEAVLQGLKGVSLLAWRGAQQRVGYANVEKVGTVNTIRRGERIQPLLEAPRDLSRFTYAFKGTRRTIDEFMTQLNAVGLIVITDGRIVLERYAQGNTADTRWTSFSVAKSVTSLLYGVAIKDGHIKSLDDPVVKYVPELAGTSYDGVTLRHLLHMSSGVAWTEDPSDPASDVSQLPRLNAEGGFKAQVAYMGQRPRRAPAGQRFNYSTGETDLAGAALRAAVGRTLSDYLSEKIWRPFGMQADAYWITMRGSDLERGGCCISATLRDYGRIGLVALGNGRAADGTTALPEGWMRESTQPSPSSKGYGMYWWLRPDGRYFASGSFGQHIEIAPAERTVVAIQSYWPHAFNDDLVEHNDTFVDALIAAVRGPS